MGNKKVYISLPISKRPEETIREREKAACKIADAKREELNALGYEAVTPFDACPVGSELSNEEKIGKDITLLLTCECIYKMPGWRKSDGCTLEHVAAQIYGIKEIGNEI